MSGVTLKNIGFNAVEDSSEDAFASIIHSRMRMFSKPFLDKYKGDSITDEFMQNFINVLTMGSVMWAMTKFSYYFERMVTIFTGYFVYIQAGKLKNIIKNRFKALKLRGKSGGKVVTNILGADRTPERIEMMKLVDTNIHGSDKKQYHLENMHQKNNVRVDNYTNDISKFKSTSDLKYVGLMTDLTFRGAWLNTQEHKKIFEKATGQKVLYSGQGSWGSLYAKLNEFTEFHRTAKGEIESTATLLAKEHTMKGIK